MKKNDFKNKPILLMLQKIALYLNNLHIVILWNTNPAIYLNHRKRLKILTLS